MGRIERWDKSMRGSTESAGPLCGRKAKWNLKNSGGKTALRVVHAFSSTRGMKRRCPPLQTVLHEKPTT